MTDVDSVQILDGGEALPMGGGVWTIMQRDEHGVANSVVVDRASLEAMLAASR